MVLGAVLVFLCACVSSGANRPAAPILTPPLGGPVTANGTLYVRCLSEAIDGQHVDVESDKSNHLLRFTCRGEAAHRLYDGLAARSTAQHAEWTREGKTLRSTQKIERDLFGSDYCSFDGGTSYECSIVLNVGQFLSQEPTHS